MWRKITDIGLKTIYNDDEKVREILKLPQALAFIPKEDVKLAFSLINTNKTDPKITEFYNYVEDFYIGKNVIEMSGRGRWRKEVTVFKEPMFSINLWNVNDRISECIPRTNNFVEAWHNAFSSMLNIHPLVYSLVNSFKSEQKRVESELIRLKTGIVYKRRPKYIILDDRIKTILKSYDQSNIKETLCNLSLIMKY